MKQTIIASGVPSALPPMYQREGVVGGDERG